MEDLNNQLATRPPSVMVQSRDGEEGASVPLTKEYVESLEKEITEVKSKNRSLQQQIEDVASQSAKPPLHGRSALQGVHPQDPFVQAHIKELNGTIGKNPTRHVIIIIIIVVVVVMVDQHCKAFIPRIHLYRPISRN